MNWPNWSYSQTKIKWSDGHKHASCCVSEWPSSLDSSVTGRENALWLWKKSHRQWQALNNRDGKNRLSHTQSPPETYSSARRPKVSFCKKRLFLPRQAALLKIIKSCLWIIYFKNMHIICDSELWGFFSLFFSCLDKNLNIIYFSITFNSIQVYLSSAFHNTNRCKAALQEVKFPIYLV